MIATKRTPYLLAGSMLALAMMVPVAASAHTHVFLGISLGGLFAPPVTVYAPPAYYPLPPPPSPVYYARPAYYAPPVVYTTPRVVYYPRWGYGDHHDWRHGWHEHRDRGWHRRWHEGGDNDDQ